MGDALVCLGECVSFAVDFIRARGVGVEDDAIAEGGGLALLEGEVEGRALGVEDVRAQRVGGEEAVAAGVPVGGVAGVAGVVEDGDGLGFAVRCVPVSVHQRPRVPQTASP